MANLKQLQTQVKENKPLISQAIKVDYTTAAPPVLRRWLPAGAAGVGALTGGGLGALLGYKTSPAKRLALILLSATGGAVGGAALGYGALDSLVRYGSKKVNE